MAMERYDRENGGYGAGGSGTPASITSIFSFLKDSCNRSGMLKELPWVLISLTISSISARAAKDEGFDCDYGVCWEVVLWVRISPKVVVGLRIGAVYYEADGRLRSMAIPWVLLGSVEKASHYLQVSITTSLQDHLNKKHFVGRSGPSIDGKMKTFFLLRQVINFRGSTVIMEFLFNALEEVILEVARLSIPKD
ncbi:hypothetical protein Tco_0007671 [Tanacetum coccineum]